MSARVWRDPRVWCGVLVSALFLWLAFRGVDPARMARAVREADVRLFPLVVLVVFGVIWVRCLRWRVLLKGVGAVHSASLFRATIIGFTVNYVIPIRAGELLRAYLVGTQWGMSRSATFATVVVERLLDVFSVLLLFLAILIFFRFPNAEPHLLEALKTAAMVATALGLSGVAGLWLVRRRTRWLEKKLEFTLGRIAPGPSRRIVGLLEAFGGGIAPIRSTADLATILVSTGLMWAGTAASIALLAAGFHLEIPWEASWLIVVALAFGVSVPSAPGFVGTFHYAVMICLMVYGVQKSDAVSFAVALHALHVLPVFLLGLGFLWWEGLNLGKVMSIQDARED